jgi:hypothetical protein
MQGEIGVRMHAALGVAQRGVRFALPRTQRRRLV